MADVKQSQTDAAKINARQQNHPTGRQAQASVTTHHRTITNTYHSGFQAQKGDVPKQGDDQ